MTGLEAARDSKTGPSCYILFFLWLQNVKWGFLHLKLKDHIFSSGDDDNDDITTYF